jgi:hypothetical protein
MMNFKLLTISVLLIVISISLKSQVTLYSKDSILIIDTIRDETISLRLVIDRSNDILNKDTTFLFYIAKSTNSSSLTSETQMPWIYSPFGINTGNDEYGFVPKSIRGIYYSQNIDKLVNKEYRKLKQNLGNIAEKRIKVESKEKKEIKIELSVANLKNDYEYFISEIKKNNEYNNENFFIYLTYNFSYVSNPYFTALNRYDSRTRKRISPYNGYLKCPKIKVVFK